MSGLPKTPMSFRELIYILIRRPIEPAKEIKKKQETDTYILPQTKEELLVVLKHYNEKLQGLEPSNVFCLTQGTNYVKNCPKPNRLNWTICWLCNKKKAEITNGGKYGFE